MGVVYRAEHAMLRRPTAVKLLDANEVGEQGIARFEKEVQLTAQLTHPSTVAIYDYGRTADGVFYYAMELIDGLDLGALVREHGPQPPDRIVALIRQACGSLAEAHRRGLVHRDVKPENLIVTHRPGQGDVVKVLDFGLVKDVRDDAPGLSQTGAILGTPLFLSPEAIETPERVGPKSDLYALGCVMYFLLTGEHVFDAKSVIELCAAHVAKEPVRPSERMGVHVPRELEDVVMACLAKDPNARPASAEALAAMLDEALDGTWSAVDAERWWRDHAAEGTSAYARI
jgi:serine/threonine-protein kinase